MTGPAARPLTPERRADLRGRLAREMVAGEALLLALIEQNERTGQPGGHTLTEQERTALRDAMRDARRRAFLDAEPPASTTTHASPRPSTQRRPH